MKDNKIPSPLVSLLPVFVLILLLFVTIRTFGSDALSGGSQVCLLVATAVCVLFKFSYRIFIQQEIKYVHKYDAIIVLVILDEVACYHILHKTIVYT